jgi:hypothetical protein
MSIVEWEIKNEQSTETGNTGYIRRIKTQHNMYKSYYISEQKTKYIDAENATLYEQFQNPIDKS